jgi:hypothetical protein
MNLERFGELGFLRWTQLQLVELKNPSPPNSKFYPVGLTWRYICRSIGYILDFGELGFLSWIS